MFWFLLMTLDMKVKNSRNGTTIPVTIEYMKSLTVVYELYPIVE